MPKTSKLPDFFLAGSSKAGTTSICDSLAQHPDICFSSKKEPNFFCSFDTDLGEIPNEDWSQYQSLFDVQKPDQLIGEGSVKYLNSPQAAYWMQKYVPSAKIIFVLRNPVQRVVSLYEMYIRLGIEKAKIMGQDEAFTPDGFVVKQGLLYDRIMRYINAFSRSQVLIMTFDDFVKKRTQAFHELFQFIGVEDSPNVSLNLRNKGGVPSSNYLSILTNRNLVATAKRVIPKSKHSQLDYFIKSKFFKKVSLKPEQEKFLRGFFCEDVKKISDLIGRDLCLEWQLLDSALDTDPLGQPTAKTASSVGALAQSTREV